MVVAHNLSAENCFSFLLLIALLIGNLQTLKDKETKS